MREAHVITDMLHEQLAKDLFLYRVPKRNTTFLGKVYCAASLLLKKEQATQFQSLLGSKTDMEEFQD